jgi:hypothetical protein
VVQTSGVVVEPPLQYHPAITPRQVDKQPFEFVFVPSSQVSPKTLSPSPQTAPQLEGTENDPAEHVNPAAGPTHPIAQPIPSFELSSHVSGAITLPSPHIGVQTFGTAVVQEYPVSIVLQSLEHPFPEVTSPSSQASV